MTWLFGRGGAVRRVEGPAGVDAAAERRDEREQPAEDVDVPAEQVDPRESEVLRADHDRHQEVAEHRRDRRDQEEEDHHHAVHGEELVVGLGREQVAGRRQQLEPDQEREDAAEDEEDGDRDQVEHRDALVVLGQQPRREPVAVVEVIQGLRSLSSPSPGVALDCGIVGDAAPVPEPPCWLERLDVCDQLEQLFLGDQPLERRHDRLEAGDDLGLRVEDRLADVASSAVTTLPSCSSTGLPNRLASTARAPWRRVQWQVLQAEILKQLRAGRDRRVRRAAAAQPCLEVRRLHRDRPSRSSRSASVPQYSAQNRW